VTRNVAGVPDGLQHYNVREHALERIPEGPRLEEIHAALLTDPFAREANAIFLLAAVFARSQKKYGPRGYRYIVLEAGHIAQTICLLATERGLGSLCMGGFFDGRLNGSLGLDGVAEAALYAVAVGHPSQA
jgi:SagB-type dehydrogenase family enzyme